MYRNKCMDYRWCIYQNSSVVCDWCFHYVKQTSVRKKLLIIKKKFKWIFTGKKKDVSNIGVTAYEQNDSGDLIGHWSASLLGSRVRGGPSHPLPSAWISLGGDPLVGPSGTKAMTSCWGKNFWCWQVVSENVWSALGLRAAPPLLEQPHPHLSAINW